MSLKSTLHTLQLLTTPTVKVVLKTSQAKIGDTNKKAQNIFMCRKIVNGIRDEAVSAC